MSNVAEITAGNFDDTVKEGVTLIDFWAEWCGPCKMISPMIEEIAADYEGKAKVGKINIDNESEIAARFNVSSIPTLMVFKNGAEEKRFVGVTQKALLAEALDAASA